MRRLSVGTALLLAAVTWAAPVFADDWTYDSDGMEASVSADGYRLVAVCDKRGLVVYYGVPSGEIADELVDLDRAYVVFTVDQTDGGRGRYTSVNSNFRVDEGERRIGLGGELAAELISDFRRASRNIVVGISPDKPGATFTKFNNSTFSAKGSTAALKALLADCTGPQQGKK